MSTTTTGTVTNGVVIPNSPLPEGAQVEIQLQPAPSENSSGPSGPSAPGLQLTPAQLRKLPRERRQAILAAAAEKAERDYHFDKELTGFEAFSEEELDDE